MIDEKRLHRAVDHQFDQMQNQDYRKLRMLIHRLIDKQPTTDGWIVCTEDGDGYVDHPILMKKNVPVFVTLEDRRTGHRFITRVVCHYGHFGYMPGKIVAFAPCPKPCMREVSG